MRRPFAHQVVEPERLGIVRPLRYGGGRKLRSFESGTVATPGFYLPHDAPFFLPAADFCSGGSLVPGPAPKPSGRRQRHPSRAGGAPVLALVPAAAITPPACPRTLLKKSAAEWKRLWALPVAQIWDGGDHLVLERLIRLKDEEYRIAAAIARKRVVKGSRGQPRLNPLMKRQETLWTEIRQLEDRDVAAISRCLKSKPCSTADLFSG